MEPSGVVDSSRQQLRSTVIAALVAASALIAACAGPAATAPPASALPTVGAPTAVVPTSAPSATAAATAAASHAPGLFQVVGSDPVILRTIVPNRGAVLPGAVVVDGRTYHAWVVAFGDSPSAHDLLHVTSPDAITWTAEADASLAALSAGIADPGAIPTSIVRGAGEWVMYFRGAPAADRQAGEVWRSTAPALGGPWSTDGEAVVHRGPAGAWDSGGLDFPSVIRTASGYTMLYSGVDLAHPDAGSIGLATSPDGIKWTKHGDPVIQPGLCGAHDARAIQQPRVVQGPDGLIVAYAGYAGAPETLANPGLASSTDGGVTWACRWPTNALETTGLPDGIGLHTLTPFQRGDRLALLFEWFNGSGTDIWLAEASAAFS